MSMATVKWQNQRLKNVTTKIGSGATPRGGQGSYKADGIPLIRSLNVYDLHFSYDGLAFIDVEQADELANVEVEQGDVLLNITGASVCRCTSVPSELVPARVNQHVSIVRADGVNLDGKYLKYVLVSPAYKNRLLGLATTGATREALTKSDIENFEIDLPLIQTQSCIASILSAYDDLIENNEKRIKILEEMARRLYTEWFVKFNLPAEVLTKAGFPEGKIKLVDSGTNFGKIPEGWAVKKLSEMMSFVRGRSYSSEQISDIEGEYYIVNLKSFNRGGGFRFDGAKYYTGPVNVDQFLKQGDVVVAVTDMTNDRAVIARPARVPRIPSQKTTLSADVVKMVSEKIPSSFIYYSLLDHRFTEATKHKANGANVLHLKPAAILEYRTAIPPVNLLNEFESKCKGILGLIDVCLDRNQSLAKVRDLLIPQLVTGKRELTERYE